MNGVKTPPIYVYCVGSDSFSTNFTWVNLRGYVRARRNVERNSEHFSVRIKILPVRPFVLPPAAARQNVTRPDSVHSTFYVRLFVSRKAKRHRSEPI
jgi:hypothetical protein